MKGSHIQVLQFGNDLSNYNKNNDKIKKKNLGLLKKINHSKMQIQNDHSLKMEFPKNKISKSQIV